MVAKRIDNDFRRMDAGHDHREDFMLVLVIAVFTLALAAPADAQVQVNIGIHLPAPPPLVVVPEVRAVRYVPSASANLFFYAGQYWAFVNGGWHVSGGYNGPWIVVAPTFVPRPVLLVPVAYYRVPPGHWKPWQKQQPPRWREEWGGEWAAKREWKDRNDDHDRGRGKGADKGHDRDDDQGKGKDKDKGKGHGRNR